MTGMPEVGEAAPDLTLDAHDGRRVTLSSLWAGRALVLYFMREFT